MGDRSQGLHPAWISVAGFAGAAVALIGVGIPLNSTRKRLRKCKEASQSREQQEQEAAKMRAVVEKLAAREREARLAAEEKAGTHDSELQAANAEVARLRARLARALADQQRTPSAQDPQQARRLQAEAHQLLRGGQPREALKRLEAAIQADPRNPSLYVDRGYLRLQAKDPTAAIADFEAALRIDSNFAMAWNNLAMVRLSQKQGPLALKLARRALQCDPSLVNAWVMRMAAAKMTQDWAEVEIAARGALERLPETDRRRQIVTATLKAAREARAKKTPTGQ